MSSLSITVLTSVLTDYVNAHDAVHLTILSKADTLTLALSPEGASIQEKRVSRVVDLIFKSFENYWKGTQRPGNKTQFYKDLKKIPLALSKLEGQIIQSTSSIMGNSSLNQTNLSLSRLLPSWTGVSKKERSAVQKIQDLRVLIHKSYQSLSDENPKILLNDAVADYFSAFKNIDIGESKRVEMIMNEHQVAIQSEVNKCANERQVELRIRNIWRRREEGMKTILHIILAAGSFALYRKFPS
jgi:hypothetical protein